MSESSFLYSIVLPVRNGGEYIKECVLSILDQSLCDFNLHILDNCSRDGTVEWLKSLQDRRILIHSSVVDLSMEENWGRIVSIPKNKFLTIIGHDDILDKAYLEVMDSLIKKYPQASLYQSHFRYINSSGKIIRRCKPMSEKQSVDEFLGDILTDKIDTMGTGYMMRSSDYDKIGGIQPYPNLLFADHELWLRLTAITYKATAMKECFSFRIHQSVSKMSDVSKYSQAFFTFLKYLITIKNENPAVGIVIEKYIIDYISYYCQSLSHRLLKTPLKKRQGMTIVSFVQQCSQYADILYPGNRFNPYEKFNMRLTKWIDNEPFLKKAYLLFRKVYKKSIYK